MDRRQFLLSSSAVMAGPAFATEAAISESTLVQRWYGLVLQLVRHTPTQSPPVAARTFAYLGSALWETFAAIEGHTSLAGQVNAYDEPPSGARGAKLGSAIHGALYEGVGTFFANTGPSGQQAIQATEQRLRASLPSFDPESAAFGAEVTRRVVHWSSTDGGAVVRNLGFAEAPVPTEGPHDWVPTGQIRIQQAPLLPDWGDNRPIALADTENFQPGAALPYSTEAGSPFHDEALEVYEVARALTDEQRLIARFWSDDPMLTPTPPGHWISILLGIAERDALPIGTLCDALARVGISQNDAFIACWRAKYRYNLLRPVTYIRANIDPAWQPLLITPPFPEYPSGHSSQSAAAAEVLSALLGQDYAFEDKTHIRDGLPARGFASFRAAAVEAALSRLYGGIHFRHANEQGAVQGARVGQAVMELRTL